MHDFEHSDTLYENTVEYLVDGLRRSAMVLVERYHFVEPSPEIELLLKQIVLAVFAFRDIPKEHVAKTLELNRMLPSLPASGIDELIETTCEMKEFYSYVGHEPTTLTQTRVVSGELAGRFVRPDFPIVFDDDD